MQKTDEILEILESNIKYVKHIQIGMDPDLVKSGFAIVISAPFRKQSVLYLSTLPFFSLLETIKTVNINHANVPVMLEAGWLNKISNYHKSATIRTAGRIGKNVGENHAVGKLVEEYLKINNIAYRLIKPSTIKWDAKLFKQITGYTATNTNSEMRDAVRTAWR